jgi:glycosyltransferase involved in cell wall biosynthesis
LNKPKILYLSDTDISKPGGAQQSMKVLMEGLKPEFDTFILTPNGKLLNNNHFVLERYNKFTLRRINFFKVIKMINEILFTIRKIKPEIIHVQMPATLVIVNFLFEIKALNKDIKLIYTDRGVFGRYGKITTKSIKSFIKKADKIITTTTVNKENYMKYLPKYDNYKDKFQVIYNTAGEKFDYYHDSQRDLVRKSLNIKSDDYVIGFCGRYSEQKNWPLAYEIIKSCNQKLGNLVYMIIIGTDNTETNKREAGKFSEDIKELVGEDRVKSYINLNNDQMSELYYAMDSFLLTSKWESFGRTAIEAMARKNIVIGTNVDGLAEVIGNDRFLFEYSERAVEILLEILKGSEEKENFQEYFYNRYHENFGTKNNINKHKDLYRSVLAQALK